MTADKPPTFSVEPPPKRGPGRPPGATASTKASRTNNENIAQAMATLDSLYNMASVALMMANLPETYTEWNTSTASLRSSNEDALKAAPKLAAWLANAGSTGGAAAFVIAHGMAVAGVVAVSKKELAAKAADAMAKATEEKRENDPSWVPGL